jgi:hypothetical protein
VIELPKPSDDDDDVVIDPEDKDKEEYEDPIVYGANLSVSIETVLIAIFAAVTIFI